MKQLIITLLFIVNFLSFADTVVIKKHAIYIPTDLGRSFICQKKLKWSDIVMGYYYDEGVFVLSSSLAVEKAGSISCDNGKEYTLVNMEVVDRQDNELEKVYAINNFDILN